MLAITGMVEEQKLPEGWNLSDDSEDDYTPVKKNGRRRRKSEDDSDSEEEKFRERKKMKIPNRQRSRNLRPPKVLSARVKSEKTRSMTEECVICKKEVQGPFATGPFAIGRANMKHHLASEHYFPEGGFKDIVRAAEEDIGPEDLLPKDLVGRVYRWVPD